VGRSGSEVSRTAKVLFRPGQVLATPGALKATKASGDSPLDLLMRHLTGDWREMSEHDQKGNEFSVREGFRILSAYKLSTGVVVWLITEADRSSAVICSRRNTRIMSVKVSAKVSKPALARLIAYINRKKWWHVPPQDPHAYEKRGKFLASSFSEAEFYGRPRDTPERVTVANPLVGDERTIADVLGIPPQQEGMSLEKIAEHDAKWRRAALAKGYDSLVLMSSTGFAKFSRDGKPPRSIELNILNT